MKFDFILIGFESFHKEFFKFIKGFDLHIFELVVHKFKITEFLKIGIIGNLECFIIDYAFINKIRSETF
jgi:hypothetical protein